MPERQVCEACGAVMDFVSIELGYSCRNPECPIHMSEEESCVSD